MLSRSKVTPCETIVMCMVSWMRSCPKRTCLTGQVFSLVRQDGLERTARQCSRTWSCCRVQLSLPRSETTWSKCSGLALHRLKVYVCRTGAGSSGQSRPDRRKTMPEHDWLLSSSKVDRGNETTLCHVHGSRECDHVWSVRSVWQVFVCQDRTDGKGRRDECSRTWSCCCRCHWNETTLLSCAWSRECDHVWKVRVCSRCLSRQDRRTGDGQTMLRPWSCCRVQMFPWSKPTLIVIKVRVSVDADHAWKRSASVWQVFVCLTVAWRWRRDKCSRTWSCCFESNCHPCGETTHLVMCMGPWMIISERTCSSDRCLSVWQSRLDRRKDNAREHDHAWPVQKVTLWSETTHFVMCLGLVNAIISEAVSVGTSNMVCQYSTGLSSGQYLIWSQTSWLCCRVQSFSRN
jgi:hypothetical protein